MSYEDKHNIEDVARNAQSNSAEAMYYIQKLDKRVTALEDYIKMIEVNHKWE